MVRLMDRSIDLLDALDYDSGTASSSITAVMCFSRPTPPRPSACDQHEGPTTRFSKAVRLIRARFPFVTDRVLAMLHIRRAGFMNAIKLGQWLLSRASAHGVELVHDESPALIVQRALRRRSACIGNRDRGACDGAGRRSSAATGPLALEIDVPIVNELHGKVSFEDGAGVVPRDAPLMIWNDRSTWDRSGSFRQRCTCAHAARSRCSASGPTTRASSRPVSTGLPGDYAHIVLKGLAVMCPGLSHYIDHVREAIVDGGYYCKAPDNRPLIGPTRISGVYLLGALSGFGIMASQAAAELLAAHLLDRPLPDYAAAFRPSRFDDPTYRDVLARLDSKSGQL